MNLREYEARNIAILKPSALGDIVHALPVLTAIRRRYPRAKITWVVHQGLEPLLQGHPDLNATLPFDRAAIGRGLWHGARTYRAFLSRIRHSTFDLVLDLQGLFRTGLMCWASRAKVRVGLASAREGAAWSYTHKLSLPQPSMHAVDRYWLAAEALGAGDGPKVFRFPDTERERQAAQAILGPLPRPWVGLCVGARWITKRWLPEHFLGLASRSQEEFGGTIVFLGGKDEQPLVDAIAPKLRGPFLDRTGKTSLLELVGTMRLLDIVVSNDTGPLHVAAALGLPVVAPFTCTQPRLTGPYGQLHHCVETTVWCHGSTLKKCGRLDCMRDLTADRVWPLLREHLHRCPSNCHSA